jgi:hypothetical protein
MKVNLLDSYCLVKLTYYERPILKLPVEIEVDVQILDRIEYLEAINDIQVKGVKYLVSLKEAYNGNGLNIPVGRVFLIEPEQIIKILQQEPDDEYELI